MLHEMKSALVRFLLKRLNYQPGSIIYQSGKKYIVDQAGTVWRVGYKPMNNRRGGI